MRPIIPADGYDPGIYFDMSDEAYHADPALGSTDIRRLLQGPSEFHYSWSGNPDAQEQEETDALTFGRAVHKLVLEGEDTFTSLYGCKPEGPDVLVTAKDMIAWLQAHSMMARGSKETMGQRILDINPRVRIQEFEVQRMEREGKTVLSYEAFTRIMMAGAYITRNPQLARSFQGGHREVSVFWVRRGVRLKCRFDYLRLIRHAERRTAVISDLKSFGKLKVSQPIKQAVRETAAGYKHQAAHYMDGWAHARRLIADGQIHGPHEAGWVSRLGSSEAVVFAFVLFKSMGAPYADAVLLSPVNPIIDIARRDIETALDTFTTYHSAFGAGGPWVSMAEPEELSIDDLPRWAV